MSAKNTILIGLALLLMGGAGYFLFAPRSANDIFSPPREEEKIEDEMMENKEEDAMMEKEKGMIQEGEEMMEKGGMMASLVAMDIKDFAFTQKELRVTQGTKVTWTNQDTVGHTVTSDTGAFESELLGKSQSFTHTFSEKGTFSYYCAPHPNMIARVIVE